MSTKITKEITRLLKDNELDYAILNLQECGGKMENMKQAIVFLAENYPTLTYLLVSATTKRFSLVCKGEKAHEWYTYIRNNLTSTGSYGLTIEDNIIFVTVDAEYPEKSCDDFVSQAFSYLHKNNLIPEQEEEFYPNPEDFGIGAW